MKTNRIYTPGYLTAISDSIYAGKPTKEIKRLTTDELARIPQIYARLPLDVKIPELEDSKDYPLPDGGSIKGGDIKAITMLMYDKPRTAYWKPATSQTRDSSVCGAVPLALLGFRNFRAQKYNKWNHPPEGDLEFTNFDHLSETWKPEFREDCQVVERLFHIDLMLGRLLSSTYYNVEEGKLKLRKDGNGLLTTAACLFDLDTEINFATIRFLREYGVGNYKGGFATAYGAINISVEPPDNVCREYVEIYNVATTAVKLLLSQRWVWYGNHRNSDMICDITNWDNMPKSVDTSANSFVDLQAQDMGGNTGLKGVFGL